MPLRALPPQGSASANFATWAVARGGLTTAARSGEKYTPLNQRLNPQPPAIPLKPPAVCPTTQTQGSRQSFYQYSPKCAKQPPAASIVPSRSSSSYPDVGTFAEIGQVTQVKTSFFESIAAAAQRSGRFGDVVATAESVQCAAAASAQPATYRIELDAGRVYVSLVMADRWQSHSIEADLLNTGDKLEDLVSEELTEVGYTEQTPGDSITTCEHFRSEDKLFTFRSRIPVSAEQSNAAAIASLWLLAYEATFRHLGDMNALAAED